MPRYNPWVVLDFWRITDGKRDGRIFEGEDFTFANVPPRGGQPGRRSLDISVNIQKSIASVADQASVQIFNHPLIESFYLGGRQRLIDLDQIEIELDILHGDTKSGESNLLFTGSVVNFNIGTGSNSRSLNFKAQSSIKQSGGGVINHVFKIGQSYREIVEYVFNDVLLPNHQIQLVTLKDPHNALERKLERPLTASGSVVSFLDELAQGVDQDLNTGKSHPSFYWGVGRRFAENKNAYFVSRDSSFDLGAPDNIVRELSYETGRHGLINFNPDHFSFDHAPDVLLDIGNRISTEDYPQVKERTKFEGRIDSITANLSTNGSNVFGITCSWIGGDEKGLTYLPREQEHMIGKTL